MTTSTQPRRKPGTPDQEITPITLRLPAVLAMTGLSKATLQRRVARGLFPRPRQLSERAVGWLREDIVNWGRELPEANALPPRPKRK